MTDSKYEHVILAGGCFWGMQEASVITTNQQRIIAGSVIRLR